MNNGIFGFPRGEGPLPVPEGSSAVIVRTSSGAKIAAQSPDNSIAIVTANGQTVVQAGKFREVTGDPYTLVTASRALTADDWSLVGEGSAITERTLYVLASNPATAVALTVPDDDEIAAPNKSFVIRVAATQTGAVTIVPSAGGTLNGGTAAIRLQPGGTAILKVLSNTNDNPVMDLLGNIVSDLTVDGDMIAGTQSAPYNIKGFGLILAATEKTASFVWALADQPTPVSANHATVAIVGTIPPNADVAFEIGAHLFMEQTGAAAASFAAGSGVTLNKPSDRTLVARARYSKIGAVKTATNTWTVFGDLGT